MNKNLKYITLALLVILVALPYLGRTTMAQDLTDCDSQECDSFEELIIPKTPEGLALEVKFNDVESQLRDADEKIISYIAYSILAIRDVQTAALDQFKIWYRKRKNAEDLATKGVAEGLLNFIYSMTVKKVFPKPSLMEEFFQTATQDALEKMVGELKSPGRDVDLFLDELEAAKNKYNAEIAKIPYEFPNKYPEEFLSAKWEYISYLRKDSLVVPAEAKKYLSTKGISEPTDAFRKELLENIFASYIERIMRAGGNDSYIKSYPDAAMAEALYRLDPIKNFQRFCKFQRRGVYTQAHRRREECHASR